MSERRYTIVPLEWPRARTILFAAELFRKEEQMAAGDQGLRDLVLYLPASLRDRAEEMASRESVSLNLFVAMAVAEKLQRLQLQRSLGTSERDELPGVTNAFSGSLIH